MPVDDVAEERGLGRKILRAVDFAAEPMPLELGQDVVQAGAGNVHLVERLHRGEPRGAALVGFAVVLVGARLIAFAPLARPRLMREHGERRARGIAALVGLGPCVPAPRPAPRYRR